MGDQPTASPVMTPMMRQYFEIKAAHPDAILFFRLGDFYEMFLDDAVVAAKILDITLTSRNKGATDEVPLSLPSRLWQEVDAEIGATDPDWAERAGAFSISLRGVQSYGGIIRKTTPKEFLTQQVSLFNLYYHGGDMAVVEEGVNRATLRLSGLNTDDRDTLFCRRQTGGLEKALSIAGGKSARVRHVRCAIEGDAFCEWDVRWE